MSNFESAFAYTVGNEGKYSNDKNDSGGPTMYGITQADLARWYGRPVTAQEVKNMPLEVAHAIYKKHYWDSMALDLVKNDGIATCMFDVGVVRGIGVPPIYAQQICGVKADGHIGPITLAAMNGYDPASFITQFSASARNGFLAIVARRPSQVVFIRGWLNRAKRLLTLIHS